MSGILNASYQRFKTAFSRLSYPFAWLDMDALRENIRAIDKRCAGKPIRIASKSIRCIPVLQIILKESKFADGLMTFSAQETAWLSQKGFDNLLPGYPFYHEQDLRILAEEVKKGKRIYLMTDCREHIARAGKIARETGCTFSLCLDADMSSDFPGLHFGVYRSNIRKVEEALTLLKVCQDTEGVELKGVMGYEAQIAGVGDQAPGKMLMNSVIRFLQKRSAKEVFDRRMKIVDALKKNRASLDFVNGGGTGSVEQTLTDHSVTEITVGSGYFSSGLFDLYSGFQHKPAAGFALEIVRKPSENLVTCLGGGYIGSGSAGKEKLPVVMLPEGGTLLENEGAGEVQTPVGFSKNNIPEIGDPVFFRHAKAGELCERFLSLEIIEGNKHTGSYPTYRGEGKCFL